MKTVSKSVPAKNLPADWQEEGEMAPDDRVTVTVEQEDPQLTELRQGVEEAAAALGRGEGVTLTEADIEEIKRRGRERRRAQSA